MKKLIFADTFSLGAFHETFNASSLMMFATIYPEVIYRASKSSKNNVERLLNQLPEHVHYRPISLLTGKGSLGDFLHLFSSSIWNVVLALKQRHDEVLFFNYNTLWTMKLLNLIARYRKTDILITCHGELEFLQNGTKLNVFSQAGMKLFDDPDWTIADTLHFCVLGESILKNLPHIVNANHLSHFITFEHSFIPHEVKPLVQDGICRIATVGTVRTQKGINDILFVGNSLASISNVEFYALGRVTCPAELLSQSNVRFIPGSENDYVSKEILNQYIDKMDYLIFTIPTDGYKLRASGALFDAIDREKFILSLHNDYFDHLFSLAPLGKLFDSVEEIVDYLKNKHRKSESPKIDYQQNKEILSYNGAAKKFKGTLRRLHLI
jgi:hypothetical protein